MYKVNPRQVRINEEFKREISALIMNGLKDPRIHPMTTVIETQVTKDLKYCKVFISVLGNQEAQEDTIKGLNSSKGYIRSELAKRINMRNTPELTFVSDQSIEYSIKMSKLIDEIKVKEISEDDLDDELEDDDYEDDDLEDDDDEDSDDLDDEEDDEVEEDM
jgi:ribosome-binding factor A